MSSGISSARACARCLSDGAYGSSLVLSASLSFALSNALGKEFLLAHGTPATLMLGRGTLAWLFNAAVAKALNGDNFGSVLLCRGLPRRTVTLLFVNGGLNAMCVLLLFVALDTLVTFADAFGILLGVYTAASMTFARALDRAERAAPSELLGGAITLLGVLLVSQPSWLFPSSAGAGPTPLGVLLLVLAGCFVGSYNVGCRHLSRAHGASSAVVNSASMLALRLLALLLLAVCEVGTRGRPPAWARIEWPASARSWAALLAYCLLITLSQLLFIGGLRYVRASTASVLGATEVVFASLLGILVLRQPTSALAVVGNAVVFGGTAIVARGAARETSPPPPAEPSAADGPAPPAAEGAEEDGRAADGGPRKTASATRGWTKLVEPA